MTNINIIIPDDLHKKIKLQAVKEDRSIKECIVQMLEKALKK